MRRSASFGLALIGLVALATPAAAYLDPAAGSMFLQLLLGGIAGVSLLVKLYWRRLLQALGLRAESADEPGAE